MKVSDYFGELYVAGRLADAGWNIYFPHRDIGFDFVISKSTARGIILRPVQVKGKYPMDEKTDKASFGYIGKLTATHVDMVLAIPYFSGAVLGTPLMTAYMPWSAIKPNAKGYKCQPALYRSGQSLMKRDSARYFDDEGIAALEASDWGLEQRVA